MLDAIAVATWISICIPWADPMAATALVRAGSGGEPYLVTDSSGQTFTGKNLHEAADHVRAQEGQSKDFYLGLAQVPLSTLRRAGMAIEDGFDECGSLEIGYEAFLYAYDFAKNVEKTPIKRIAAAFAYYRTRVASIDLPYAKKAADLMMTSKPVAPAPIDSRSRADMMAEWAAGFAQRLGHRAALMHAGAQSSFAAAAQQ